jgi:hypothetical protein
VGTKNGGFVAIYDVLKDSIEEIETFYLGNNYYDIISLSSNQDNSTLTITKRKFNFNYAQILGTQNPKSNKNTKI